MKGSAQKTTAKPQMMTPLLLRQSIEAERAPTRGWNDLSEYKSEEVSARGTRHEADLGKSAVQRVIRVMEALRVLPSDGIPKKEEVRLSLSEIAQCAGYRHASSLARAMRRCRSLVKTDRKFGSPSHHRWNLKASTRRRGKVDWKGNNQPSGRELSQDEAVGKNFADAKGGGGYYKRPAFIHSENFSGTPNDRLVLDECARLGLFSKGVLENVPQRVISAGTGLCIDTVCSILRKYSIYTRKIFERNPEGRLRAKKELDPATGKMKTVRIEERGEFPLFRIINRPARYEKDGRALEHWEPGAELRQPPNKIVYIGDRMLDARTGVLETQRLLAIAEAHQMQSELWWQYVAKIHGTQLLNWVGTEKHLVTFWQACRMEIGDGGYGVPRKSLDLLFPEWRPPQ